MSVPGGNFAASILRSSASYSAICASVLRVPMPLDSSVDPLPAVGKGCGAIASETIAWSVGSNRIASSSLFWRLDIARTFTTELRTGWFVGQVMKATKGQANPQVVNEVLKAKLEQMGS